MTTVSATQYIPSGQDFDTLDGATVIIGQSLQRTPEWYAARRGRFTGSEVWKLMTEPRSKAAKDAGEMSETAKSYINEKVAEIITGITPEVSSSAMQWGIENEAKAKAFYNSVFFEHIEDVDFVPFGEYGGGSPDGLVGDDGIVEIKCPFNSGIHVENLRFAASLPSGQDFKENYKEYYWQIQNNLLATGRSFCRFISYDPRFPGLSAICVVTIERNEQDITELAAKIAGAAKMAQGIINEITTGE